MSLASINLYEIECVVSGLDPEDEDSGVNNGGVGRSRWRVCDVKHASTGLQLGVVSLHQYGRHSGWYVEPCMCAE